MGSRNGVELSLYLIATVPALAAFVLDFVDGGEFNAVAYAASESE